MKLHKWIGVLLLPFVLRVPLAACGFIPPPTYSAESIEAWIIDEDTGQPLAGVIVVAHWELMGGLHPDTIGQLMVMETVTDAQGRFFFPAWGPKVRPLTGFLHNEDPALLLFKSGYEDQRLANEVTEKVKTNSLRRSEWDGKTIKMKKFTGSLGQYAERLGWFDDNLDFAFRSDGSCEWKQIPRMVVAMHLEKKRFRAQGLRNSSYYPSSLEDRGEQRSPADAAKCGSVQEYLRSYLP
jgi:hypothetical protein